VYRVKFVILPGVFRPIARSNMSQGLHAYYSTRAHGECLETSAKRSHARHGEGLQPVPGKVDTDQECGFGGRGTVYTLVRID
jgi:hypothetical protein